MQTLSLIQRQRLAAWVNTHEDGTPQPRASVTDQGVEIFSTLVLADGSLIVEAEIVYTWEEARAILGY